MARKTLKFICRSCGAVHPKWAGKCPDCSGWNTLEEFDAGVKGSDRDTQRGSAGVIDPGTSPQALPIGDIEQAKYPRWPTSIHELDRVLGGTREDGDGERRGGGIVPGSAVLLGGDPGIGKSTLLLQAAQRLAEQGQRALYVTSEESPQQTRLRAERLGATSDDLFVLADTNLARIVEQIRKVDPAVVIVDSIQMIYKGDVEAAPGSVTQLRGCCTELVYLAKASGIAVFLVGHVTKEGRLAGPRLLEHMVDTVLYFEGDRYHSHRIVRAIKNRFGATLEVGLFEMSDRGLREVADGSALLAAEYLGQNGSPGSIVCPVLQGSRCLLVEIQALTATGFLGSAKRKTSGLDGNRLAMLIAVLEKHGGLKLADQDIFASSVGGMKVIEPAADLAVALAIAGAHYNRTLSLGEGGGVCAVGEIGLGGEVRQVQQMEQRIKEAARLGFGHIVTAKVRGLSAPKGCNVVSVRKIGEALSLLA